MMAPTRWLGQVAVLGSLIATGGCGPGRPEVFVYSSLDPESSQPVLDAYARGSGVDVERKFDVESTKSVGLTSLIVQEASRPRCDLFWNNEVLNTLRLRRKGLLASWAPPNAADIPDAFKAKDGTWYGFAAASWWADTSRGGPPSAPGRAKQRQSAPSGRVAEVPAPGLLLPRGQVVGELPDADGRLQVGRADVLGRERRREDQFADVRLQRRLGPARVAPGDLGEASSTVISTPNFGSTAGGRPFSTAGRSLSAPAGPGNAGWPAAGPSARVEATTNLVKICII